MIRQYPFLCLFLVAAVLPSAVISAPPARSPAPYAQQWADDEEWLELRAFRLWAASQSPADPAERAAWLARGVGLAQERRSVFAHLIAADPAAALARTVPESVRRRLPPEVLAELERRVSGQGLFAVYFADGDLGIGHGHEIQRRVTLDGEVMRAFVYGRRVAQTTKEDIPLHGVVLNGQLALHESPARALESEEVAAAGPVLEIGGRSRRFPTAEALSVALDRLELAEAGIQPRPPAVRFEEAPDGTVAAAPLVAAAGSSHTLGPKKLLVVPVDFSDLTGTPVAISGTLTFTTAYCQNLADQEIAPFLRKSSFGQTSISATTVTPLLRMPRTAVHYATSQNSSGVFIGDETLRTDTLALAAAAGFDPSTFDRIMVVHSNIGNVPGSPINIPGSQVSYSGLAMSGGTFVVINGAMTFRTAVHELGHTYGFKHANLWSVSDGNPISLAGSSLDMSDFYDVMGAGPDTRVGAAAQVDYNPWYKNSVGWMSDSRVRTVTTSGTYRVYAFDTATTSSDTSSLLALRIPKDSGRDYWVGLRRNFSSNAVLSRGAYVIWGYSSLDVSSNLLNLTTPGGNSTDAPLGVGRGFADIAANITVRITGEGGTDPNYYLDVEVTLGPAAPAFNARSRTSATVATNASVTLQSSAFGNPVPAYQWQRLPAGQSVWANLDESGAYSGTRSPALTVRGVTAAMQGDQFRCVGTNSAGSAADVALRLNVAASAWETYSGVAGLYLGGNGSNVTLPEARYIGPSFLARDPAGNTYVTVAASRNIFRITPEGMVNPFAGSFAVRGTADGVGLIAKFDTPAGIASDASGVLYVADSGLHSIRRITAEGAVTTLAGLSGTAGAADGSGPQARFNGPVGLVVDAAGNVFVADRLNHAIRRITPAGVVTTFAGLPGTSGSANGSGGVARFSSPAGLAIDVAGNLYVGDSGNRLIRKITSDGAVSTLAGTTGVSGSADGAAASARFSGTINGLAVDREGVVYVADTDNMTIRRISGGQVTTVGGLAGAVGSADGTTAESRFYQPRGLLLDGDGGLLVADYFNYTLRRLRLAAPEPSWPTLALGSRPRYVAPGDGVELTVLVGGFPSPALQWQRSVDGGVSWQNVSDDNTCFGATSARLTLASVSAGMNGHQFRCIATNSVGSTTLPPAVLRVYTMTTFAGAAGSPGTADGSGGSARFRDPRGLTLDAAGNLYVADRGNHAVRRITPAGVVTTLGGVAGAAGSASGPASAARFTYPISVAVTRDGSSVAVADATHTVRSLAPDGSVSLVAGAANSAAFADGAGAVARFNSPSGLARESDGTLWVSDSANQVIRRIGPSGVVSTVAGLPGTSGFTNVDGRGSEARFRSPQGIALAPDGTLWVADTSNLRVRRMTVDGVVTTIAGDAAPGAMDGIGAAALFSGPADVTVDTLGDAYVADANNHTIRLVSALGGVSTIVGSASAAGSADGPGGGARLSGPRGIAVDPSGVIYIADSGNHTIRRYGPSGGVAFTQTPPVLVASPASRTVAPGTPTTLSVVVNSVATPAYQWYRDGKPIAGATDASLTLGSVAYASLGSYTVSATTAFGVVWSGAARVESSAPPNPGRLVNLSLLTVLATPDDTFTMGTVIGGSGTSGEKPVLVRAAGPSLAAFGLTSAHSDPRFEFFSGQNKIGENDDWGGGPELTAAMARVGAFAYASTDSKDAAVFQPGIGPGNYSIRVASANRTTGTVIAEIYDSTPSDQYRLTTPRLVNVSVLKQIGAGFTVGFVLGGETPRSVLVRAVGPGLANVGVTSGFVADPRLTLFSGTTEIARNDDWGGGPGLFAAMKSVGAFDIPSSSRDAAILATLNPGAYSVQIASPAGTGGIVIVEVYEVP